MNKATQSIRFDEDAHNHFKQLAEQNGTSVNHEVNRYLRGVVNPPPAPPLLKEGGIPPFEKGGQGGICTACPYKTAQRHSVKAAFANLLHRLADAISGKLAVALA
jgi:hypothetical protein